MRLAIIPARGGSKRIPRKNIKAFCGQPMLSWPIEAAINSGCFDRIIVSTDDDEIAQVAVSYGAEIPFMRPTSLADDHTTTAPVVAHAINWFQENGHIPDFVCCIYATAPFIEAADIRCGLDLINTSAADYVFSVTNYPFPIQRALRITREGKTVMLQPEHFNTRSQDLEETFHDAGQFYWGTSRAWLENRPIFSDRSMPVLLPRFRVQDIDNADDWIRAELMFKSLHS